MPLDKVLYAAKTQNTDLRRTALRKLAAIERS